MTRSLLRTPLLFLLVLLFALSAPAVRAQTKKSPAKAFGLSLLIPGLGQRYVHDGHWTRGATTYALVDAAGWLGLLGTSWRRDQLTESYRTLASLRADAQIEGKDREFFLNLATYPSSDAFLEAQLRNRAWDQVDYVADRSYQWEWATDQDFFTFRSLREDAETMGRRRTLLVAFLVGNRLLSGLTALRAAGRTDDAADLSLALSPGESLPVVHLRMEW